MPELKRINMTRIVATPAALDNIRMIEPDTLIMRVAPDEMLLLPPSKTVQLDDEYAIQTVDASFAGVWLTATQADHILCRLCEWDVPATRPVFVQGAVAAIPTKLWLGPQRVLLFVPAPYAAEMEARIA